VFDYSEAQPQREIDLIPHGTVTILQLTVRPGGAGEDGMLKRSQDGLCEMFDLEFEVVGGEFVRRKFWERFVVVGTTDGQKKASDITRTKLRAILQSARGIKRDDVSPEARAALRAKDADFNGMRFIAKIGIEKGKDKENGSGNYPDRNFLLIVVTPDHKGWHAVEQVARPPQAPTGHATAATPMPLGKPAWAT
jgi:hypothetical protein